MSWQLIARKDFEEVIRSWMIWTILGVFVLLMGIVTFGARTNDLDELGADLVYLLFHSLGGQLLLPVTALIVGYMAITGERQSGSLRILLGLSHDRRDVVFGKFCSRAAVMGVVTVVVAITAGLLIVVAYTLELGTFLRFSALTLLLALAFTGIGVGISAMTGSRARAMGGAIGSYVGFVLLWHPAVAALHYAIEGKLVGYEAPDWYLFLLSLNPLTAYQEALGGVIGQYLQPLIGWTSIVEDVPPELAADGTALLLANRAAGEAPFYLSEPAAVLVLAAWCVVPMLLGYRRFQNGDLA